MPRSFIAVESNEEVQKSLTKVQKQLKRTGADLNLVSPENIHLTLRFLGDVSESRIDYVKDAVHNSIEVGPFQAEVTGMGVFPEPGYIRVIWAGVDEGTEELEVLRKNLDENLAEIGISPDDKDFTPHFTISRVKSGKAKDKLNSIVGEYKDKVWGTVEVEDIVLMKSELKSEGPVYTPIETFELG